LVDAFLKAKTLSIPSLVPELIVCSAKFFAAWMFRRFSDPVGAEAFWADANRFLDAYVTAEVEPYVRGVWNEILFLSPFHLLLVFIWHRHEPFCKQG
jgi:hypothetical protein